LLSTKHRTGSVRQSISQSVSQSDSQSISQSVNQSVSQSVSQSVIRLALRVTEWIIENKLKTYVTLRELWRNIKQYRWSA